MAVTLPFYSDISRELDNADTLVVLARGLGMASVLASFVASRVRPNRLILALNIRREIAVQVIWPALRKVAECSRVEDPSLLLPRFVNADYSIADRVNVYATGGFVVASDNVLVHDLLCRKLPVDAVDGIVIFAADRVKPNSNTHFALTLFRRQNRTGFIKAISENAPALTLGFHHAEKVMRTLFVSRLSNWPRFHKVVKDSFSRRTPDVVDLSVPLAPRQAALVSTLRDIALHILDDLRLASRGLDLTEVYRKPREDESGNDRKKLLVANFDDVVRRQLISAPGQKKVTGGEKVRSLVSDLASVRNLLENAVDLNAVLFYQRILTIRHAHERASYWLMRRESQGMIRVARSRIFVQRAAAGSNAPSSRSKAVPAASRPRNQSSTSTTDNVGNASQVQVGEVDGISVNASEKESATVTVPILDPSPKWEVLMSILSEIEADVGEVSRMNPGAEVGRVLIAVRDQITYDELRLVLTHGAMNYMQHIFESVLPKNAADAARYRKKDAGQRGDDGQVTLTQLLSGEVRSKKRGLPGDSDANHTGRPSKRGHASEGARLARSRTSPAGAPGVIGGSDAEGNAERVASDGTVRWPWPVRLDRIKENAGESSGAVEDGEPVRVEKVLDGIRNFFGLATSSHPAGQVEVMLWCLDWSDAYGRSKTVLEQFRPSFVVMYNADVAFVRQVEVFRAESRRHAVRMYLMAYEDVVDEDRYRNTIERERSAFKTLIRERATMLLDTNQEGRLERVEDSDAVTVPTGIPGALGVRRGLGNDRDSRNMQTASVEGAAKLAKVIVDTRELRSSLPMHLHNASIEIVPVTLEVGDFVLSKSIAVERKSVSDLYGSFDSGRLSKQASALCRHYKYACLLIELDSNARLSLAATGGGIPSELVPTSIVSKMVLLMQEFPMLRLLWAVGPQDGADLFAALKSKEDEPDAASAALLGVDSAEGGDAEFNASPAALLRSLPGIDGNNISSVMRKVRNVSSLLNMPLKEMATVLGCKGKAKRLFDFANEQPGEALAVM